MAGPSPLLGYNTNVRHNGKLFHIQTEDSGVNHPHIITHLFADGGRIIASKKTAYADHLGAEGLSAIVKQLMQGQHKAMFIELRDGVYDEEDVPPIQSRQTNTNAAAEQARLSQQELENLEAAAERMSQPAASQTGLTARDGLDPRKTERPPKPAGTPRYQPTRPPASISKAPTQTKPAESIFGGDLLSEKSLDEVILSYLAEDLDSE